MSASKLRQRVHQLGREPSHAQYPASSYPHHHHPQHTLPSHRSNDGTNENTPLVNHIRSHLPEIPDLTKEDSGWRSWPRRITQTVWEVVKSNYTNVLLVFVPLGIVAGAADWPPLAIFVLNFLAIIPLAALLSFATEELAAVLGPSIGGLLNATFGNAIEFIVCIVALTKDEIRIVQASMLGSILANILLVLGFCFFLGGLRRLQSKHDSTLASTMASLQTVASAALVVPAVLYATLTKSAEDTTVNIMILSRGTSIMLLILYILYLYFQLGSHHSLFQDDDEGEYAEVLEEAHEVRREGETLPPTAAMTCLVLTTACVAVCAEFLVDSIDPIVESTGMSKTFIGIIIVPIVSNAAEHVTAVIVSWKGKMNLALCVDLGSSLQIALFVTPVLVILGWILDKPMSLHFHGFEMVIFFLSILVVNGLIRDGKSNYLEGAMLLGWYVIIGIAFYVYPDDAGESGWVFRM